MMCAGSLPDLQETCTLFTLKTGFLFVIASVAKQSMREFSKMVCFALLAMTATPDLCQLVLIFRNMHRGIGTTGFCLAP